MEPFTLTIVLHCHMKCTVWVYYCLKGNILKRLLVRCCNIVAHRYLLPAQIFSELLFKNKLEAKKAKTNSHHMRFVVRTNLSCQNYREAWFQPNQNSVQNFRNNEDFEIFSEGTIFFLPKYGNVVKDAWISESFGL